MNSGLDSVISLNPNLDPAGSNPGNRPWAWFPPIVPLDPPSGAQAFKVDLGTAQSAIAPMDWPKMLIIGAGLALLGGIVYAATRG